MAVVLSTAVGTQAAEELDSIYQVYAAISDGLGNPTVASLDTTQATHTYLRNAVNAALRAVQRDMPFTVEDTIVLSLHQYRYTLNANLVRPRDGESSGYRVEHWDSENARLTGLREMPLNEFGAVPVTGIIGFRVEGSRLIVNSYRPTADTLFVYGRGEVTPITGAVKLISYPPETEDRWAVVYHAIATIAGERNDQTTQIEYAQKYYEVTGKMPIMPGVQ